MRAVARARYAKAMSAALPFRLSRRGVVHVAGDGVRAFLDNIVTCKTAKVAPGRPVYGALLTPQGKVTHEMFVHDGGADALLLDVHAATRGELIKRLTLYRLRAKIEIADVTDAHAVLQSFGGGNDPRVPGLGDRTLAPADAGAAPDDDAYDAARIERGLPEDGSDYAPETVFPADVNLDLLNGVDFAKGCFVGQEVASRMKRKGAVRKRTVIVEADAALVPGAEITAGEAKLGAVTSAVGAAGLALLRLDRLANANAPPAANGAAVRVRFPDWFPAEAKA